MPLNPLDWTAGPFLTLYIGVAAAAMIGVLLLRRQLGPANWHGDPNQLGVLEIAYLSGGQARAADTVLVGFLAAGAATLPAKGRSLTLDAATAPLPDGFARFRNAASGETTRSSFHSAVRSDLDAVQYNLIDQGLAPRPDDIERFRWEAAMLSILPIGLGVAKIIVGSERHRPVGFLIALVLVTAFVAALALLRRPSRTRAGTAALKLIQTTNARAARAPLEAEIALAFAITGPAVLIATPYAAFAKQIPSGEGGGGGDGGGGGCGGGGCGGCGG